MNLMMVAIQFAAVNIICRIVGMMTHLHAKIKDIHRFLMVHSMWWALLAGFLEGNIAPLAFYGAVQFNALVNFDWFTKLNMVYCILTVFIVLQFSFLFYPLI